MKANENLPKLSRREREILDVLYRLGRASAAEIHESLSDPPTYTAVRTHLTILQDKGHIRYEREGKRHIFEPVVPKDEMAKKAIDRVMLDFFGGSLERVVSTLLDKKERKLSDEELARLTEIIEEARREGR